MLLAVSFYVIATTLPVTICYVLVLQFPDDHPRAELYWNIRTVVEEIGLSHYACNFYIYVATGRIFRAELRRLLCIVRSRARSLSGIGGPGRHHCNKHKASATTAADGAVFNNSTSICYKDPYSVAAAVNAAV